MAELIHTQITVCHLASLPVELIAEIALWAQLTWREEVLGPHAPYVGMKRHTTAPPEVPLRDEACCRDVDIRDVPRCLSVGPLLTAPSPAHRLAQTGRWLRNVLLNANCAIWLRDNTFYKEIAERSGVRRHLDPSPIAGGATVTYGARSLVALGACACLTPAIRSFYSTLEVVRVALPWRNPEDLVDGVEKFFLQHHDEEGSPLRHFDLEIFPSPLAPTHPIIRGIFSKFIETSRSANATYFHFSPVLTSLYIYQPFPNTPYFGMSFSAALEACAPRLEYLTIDAPNGHFDPAITRVQVPNLRYLRVLAPQTQGGRLLKALQLPAELDIHLEPVVRWRTWGGGVVDTAFEEDMVQDVIGTVALWRYAAAIAAPDQTKGIFSTLPVLDVDDEGLWHRLNTAGLDIQIDPSTTSFERACRRFPEYVSLAFAGSKEEMYRLLASPGRDWEHALSPIGKSTARRSFTARDSRFAIHQRDFTFNASLAKPVYDAVRYVTRCALMAQGEGPFNGHPGVLRLVFDASTWLPIFSLGWFHVLADFDGIVDLVFLCPVLRDCSTPFTENMWGCLDLAHLEALALYLNEPGDGRRLPCLQLETIELRHGADAEDRCQADVTRVEGRFNSRRRVEAGAQHIQFTIRSSSSL